jgi:hypothetical protein
MHRTLLLFALLGCGTSQPPVSFACGDAGATCQSATEFCDIVTKTGSNPSTTASCKAFPAGCSFCACLTDSGAVNACSIGQATCTPKDDGTYQVDESCVQ